MWLMTKAGRVESEGVRKEVTGLVEVFMGLHVSLFVPGYGVHFSFYCKTSDA
jgi:hypothetical protein